MKFVRILAVAVFFVALPLVLILSNLRLLALSQATYENGFARYGAARATRMSGEELQEAARQIIVYFRTGQPITLKVRKEWGTELLFNEREMDHLVDVRNLLQLAFRVQEVAAIYVLLFAGLTYLWYRPHAMEALARYVLLGGLLTLGGFAALAVLSALSFDALFLQFHLISFSNDLWQLDPRTDYMIRMFPKGFWFESALRLAVWSMAEGTALVGLAWGYLRWRASRA